MIASGNIKVHISRNGLIDRLLTRFYTQEHSQQYLSGVMSGMGIAPSARSAKELSHKFYNSMYPEQQQSVEKATESFFKELERIDSAK